MNFGVFISPIYVNNFPNLSIYLDDYSVIMVREREGVLE